MNRKKYLVQNKMRAANSLKNTLVIMMAFSGSLFIVINGMGAGTLFKNAFIIIVLIVFLIILIMQSQKGMYNIVVIDEKGFTIKSIFKNKEYKWDEIVNIRKKGIDLHKNSEERYIIYLYDGNKEEITYSKLLNKYLDMFFAMKENKKDINVD